MGSPVEPSRAPADTDRDDRPPPMSERHENVGPFPIRGRGNTAVRFAAGCSCGWRSEPYSTAGMAGTAIDRHLELASTALPAP